MLGKIKALASVILLFTPALQPTTNSPHATQQQNPNTIAQFVLQKYKPQPNWDKEVVQPLQVAQAAAAVKRKSDCDAQGGTLNGLDCVLPPPPPVIPTFVSVSVPQPAAYTGTLADWLYKLRTCESGGNYAINTGNGYSGAYQFSPSTWSHWNTQYLFAWMAPPAVQDAAIIANTNASAGLVTQNPGCYASTGISNKPPLN